MDDRNYENILVWIDGSMSSPEREAFESAMKNDPELAAEAALAKVALAAQNESYVIALRKNLESIMSEPPAPGNAMWPKWGKVLAAILLAAFAIFWFLKKDESQAAKEISPATPIALFEKYYPAPPVLIPENAIREFRTETGREELQQTILTLVERLNQAFSRQEHDSVSQILQQLKTADPANLVISKVDLARYQGQFLLWQGRARDALPLFDEAEKQRPDEMAQWYRAGAFLATGEMEKAVPQLKKIAAQGGHPERETAKKLLEELANQ